MQICLRCGEENPDRFRLCGFCGSALAPDLPPQEVRKTVTIVFSDLQGSTSLGETLDSESLRQVMSRYFNAMKTVLERHGGTVEKFIGDAVMAVFGLPRTHEDDALRAVRAAAEMQQALRQVNEELERDWGLKLANRTGVNTGEVVAGDVTAGQRLVTGDAVNVAARLEQAAPAAEVLIGETTYRLVKDAVEVEALDPLPLKGKAEPVPAFRLVAVTQTEGFVRHLDAPMVGRLNELASLMDAFERAVRERSCQVVTVFGEAGAGKSRLVHEFLRQISGEASVLHGRCLAYGDGLTFWPLAELVRQAASLTEDDATDRARAKVAALCGEDGAEISDRVASAIGLSSSMFPLEDTFWGARKLLEILSRRRPLVVLFDDLHWAQPTFLDLIEHIAGAAEDAPLLVLCPSRRELLDERPDWGHNGANGESISLDALSDAETELIVDNILGRSGLPKEASARITEAAQGNPLFVEQMLSMLIDDGVLQATDQGQWTLAGDLSNFSVPPNISALLSARLDRLLDEEQMVLERGAVVGQVFYTGAVQALSVESMRAQIGAYLSSLVRKELIALDEESFAGQETWRFHHVLIRDSAYGRLLKRSRAELHERFGEWLERAAGTRAREYEEILGYHFEQAYRYRSEIGPLDDQGRRLATRAAHLLASAGRRAFTREDMPATANLLERAVLVLPENDEKRLELLPDLGEALMDIGAFNKAEAFLEQAIAGGARLGDRRLEAYARLTHLALRYFTDREGCKEDVLEEVDRAIPIFEEVGDHLGLVKAWRLLATVHGTACRYGAAEEALQHAIDHAKLAGDLRQELRSLHYLALCALYGPMPVPEAILRCEQILKDATGYRRVEALVLCALAHLQAMEGRFAEARELYRRSRTTFEDIGGKVLAAATSVDSGSVELLANDPVAAEAELRRDYEVLSGIGETYLLSTTAALLAQALYSQGRFAEAERFSQISGQAAAPDDVESQVLWRCVEGKLLGRRGRVDEAEDLVREAVRLIADTEEPVSLGNALMDLAEVLCHGHKTPEAIDIIGRAVQLYDSKGNIVSATKARSQLADVSAKLARAEGS